MMYLVAVLLPMVAMASKKLSSSNTLDSIFKNGKVVPTWEEKQSHLRLEALPTQKPGRAWQIEYVGGSCDQENMIQFIVKTTNQCVTENGVSAKVECAKSKKSSFIFLFRLCLVSPSPSLSLSLSLASISISVTLILTLSYFVLSQAMVVTMVKLILFVITQTIVILKLLLKVKAIPWINA
jgi:hypothetical protein